jgi:hypothetical protein
MTLPVIIAHEGPLKFLKPFLVFFAASRAGLDLRPTAWSPGACSSAMRKTYIVLKCSSAEVEQLRTTEGHGNVQALLLRGSRGRAHRQ